MSTLWDRPGFVARRVDVASSPLVRFDASQVAACLAALRGAGSLWDLGVARTDPAGACRRVLAGRATAGQACARSDDCYSQLFCRYEAYACPGTCTSRGGDGAVCSRAADDCAYGYSCSTGSLTTDAGTCQPVLGPGADCSARPICRAGTFCDTGTSTCTVTRGDGGTCTSSNMCASGLSCQGGRCAPAPRLGEACSGPTCLADSYCDATGHCALRIADGEVCGDALVGKPGECLAGRCGLVSTWPTLICPRTRGAGETCSTGDLCRVGWAGKNASVCDGARGTCGDICP